MSASHHNAPDSRSRAGLRPVTRARPPATTPSARLVSGPTTAICNSARALGLAPSSWDTPPSSHSVIWRTSTPWRRAIERVAELVGQQRREEADRGHQGHDPVGGDRSARVGDGQHVHGQAPGEEPGDDQDAPVGRQLDAPHPTESEGRGHGACSGSGRRRRETGMLMFDTSIVPPNRTWSSSSRFSADARCRRAAPTASGSTEIEVMPIGHQVLGELRPVRGRLAAQRRGEVGAPGPRPRCGRWRRARRRRTRRTARCRSRSRDPRPASAGSGRCVPIETPSMPRAA